MDFVLHVSTSNRLDKEFCMAYLSTLLLVLDTGLVLSLYMSILKNAALAFGPRRWPFVGGGILHCLFSTLNILEEGFPMNSTWMNNW